MPQVLIESFAAALPTVATAVGGVSAFAGGAALLVPPGDAAAAADALRSLDRDAGLRRRLVEAGGEVARAHTVEAEAARIAALLVGGAA
jgi:glycosyltransferase involved in cell wall biosynthesis